MLNAVEAAAEEDVVVVVVVEVVGTAAVELVTVDRKAAASEF